jgi:hypothetical protein
MQSLVTRIDWAAGFRITQPYCTSAFGKYRIPLSHTAPPHGQAYSKGLPSKACAVWQFYSTGDSFVLVVQTTDNAHYVVTGC